MGARMHRVFLPCVCMRDHKINCMFYRPTNDDPLINRAVARFRGPFSHVELSFEDGKASSIMNGGAVFFHNKNYSNPNYTVLTIPVTRDVYDKIQAFCREAANDKVGFCMASMFLSVLPWQIMPARKRATFCSRFVTEALQHGQCPLVEGINPMLTTPTALHDALAQDQTKILDTVPGRLRMDWVV